MSAQAFVLIDGLLLPDALKTLYGRGETLEIDPLYLGTRWDGLKDKGPILVQASDRLRDEWQQQDHWQACSCLLHSPAPRSAIIGHLRHFICPPDHLGNASLLRFADPLVLHFWLASQEQAHRNRTLGPIERVQVASPRQPWHPEPATAMAGITTFAIDGDPYQWQSRFAVQGPAQLEAFEHAFDFLFKRRLHAWITRLTPTAFADQRPEQIDAWLDEVLRSGRDWGLVSEFALATWAEYSHTLGQDFTTSAGGDWQRWLTEHPTPLCPAPEQQLDAFDLYRERRTTQELTDGKP